MVFKEPGYISALFYTSAVLETRLCFLLTGYRIHVQGTEAVMGAGDYHTRAAVFLDFPDSRKTFNSFIPK